jgi:hypothetical protein
MKWVRDRTGRFEQRPHYLPEEIDSECEKMILAFVKIKYGKIEFPIKTDDLTVLIEEKADLDSCVDLSGEGREVEGMTEFMPGRRPVVKISNSLSAAHMENRLRTTLTHEFGHVHFHKFMFDIESGSGSLFPSEQKGHTIKCNRENIVGAAETDWMEWQAGYACGAILMPVGALIDTVQAFRKEKNLPFSNLSFDSDTGRQLVTVVASTFQTSKDAARVRLVKKGILSGTGGKKTAELF